MAGQLLNIAQFEHAPISAHAANPPHRARIYQFPSPVTLKLIDPREEEAASCAAGTRLALLLEIASGVLLYGIWMAWHMMH